MRFIFLTLGYSPDLIGGAYRYVTEVAERLAARGHRVDVICPNPDGSRHPESELRAGVQLHRHPNRAGAPWRNWWQENADAQATLRRLTSEQTEPALAVVCHAYFRAPARSNRLRMVSLFTGPWAEEFHFARQTVERSWPRRARDRLLVGVMRWKERETLKRMERILTISQYYAEQLPRWHGSPLPPLTLISGGVDSARFSPAADRKEVRSRLGVKPEELLFLAVRRLDPRMGLLSLIDAFAQCSAACPHARLWIAGIGPQRDALQARIDALQLSGRAQLLGFVPEAELPDRFNAADCAVMPSLDLEGFGLATVESLACGTPVIGSRAGATPELLVPLSGELLFRANDTEALAAKLRAVCSSPAWLPDRAQCREHAETNFSWDRPVTAFEQCHRDLWPEGGAG